MLSEQLRMFSFGGGIQSTACLVLAAQKKINFPYFVFANTGNDSESLDTLLYMETVSIPFAAKHGIELLTVAKNGRTLYQNCMADNRTIDIPVRMSNGAPGNRKCTSDWKIKPIARWSRQHGATRTNPAVIGIGISVDEIQRAKDSRIPHQVHEFPLLDLRLRRTDCANIIREAGLPVPPKSACWFCPYKKLREWQHMATHDPELFDKAAKLEAKLADKHGELDKKGSGSNIYLTDRLKPLKEAVLPSDQMQIEFDEDCTGYCWT